MEITTEPVFEGWNQKIKMTGTAVKHDDMVSVYSDLKSDMSNKKYSDNMTTLDPDDGTESPPLRSADEYTCIGNTRFCYHPEFLNRLFRLKSKQGKLTPIRAYKVPKHVKNTYYNEIVKKSPPKNKVRNTKRTPEHRSKDNSPKRRKVIEELFDQSKENECEIVINELNKFQKYAIDNSLELNLDEISKLLNFIKYHLTFSQGFEANSAFHRLKTKIFEIENESEWKENTFWGKTEKDVLMQEILTDPIYKENMAKFEELKYVWNNNDINRKFNKISDEITIKYIRDNFKTLLKEKCKNEDDLESTGSGSNESSETPTIIGLSENLMDLFKFIPSTPGPGLIKNDPTNGDLVDFKSNQQKVRVKDNNEWVDVTMCFPRNINKIKPEDTVVVIYIGANNGDYFHFYDRKKEKNILKVKV